MTAPLLRATVMDLQREGILLVEDGNHGEYRPRTDEFVDHGVAFIRAADMDDGVVDFDSASRINATAVARITKGIGAPGDILLSHKGTVGKLALVPDSAPPFVCSPQTTFWRTLDEERLDRRYLYCYLRSPRFAQQLRSRAGETDMAPYVSLTAQRTLLVDVPPIKTQRMIAGILGALDDKIELNRRTNETLEAMARALFQSWFVDFDPVRQKMEGWNGRGVGGAVAEVFPDTLQPSPIGPIPKGWNVRQLGSFFALQRGTTYKSEFIGLPGPVLLGLSAIRRDGGFRGDSLRTYGGASAEKLILHPGDIFVSLKDVTQSGDLLGSAARVPSTISSGRLTQDTVHLVFSAMIEGLDEFVYWTLRHDSFRAHARAHAIGTTNLSLSRDDFLGYQIAVPPPDVLPKLVAPLRALAMRFENLAEDHALTSVRDVLLPKLLSGELRIPDAERAVSAVL